MKSSLPLAVVLLSCLVLSACSTGGLLTPWAEDKAATKTTANAAARPAAQPPQISSVPPLRPVPQVVPAQPFAGQAVAPRRVALLLPLSGPHAMLGNQLMMAVQLAVQDLAPDSFVVAPYDTTQNATAAVQKALSEQTDLIIGPLFSADVAAVKGLAAQANVPVLALSNDQAQADGNTYLMGSGPAEQIQRVVAFAASKGKRRIVAVLPDNAYGNAVRAALPSIVDEPAILVQSFGYDPQAPNLAPIIAALLQDTNSYDAVLLPDADPRASTVVNTLRQAGALQNKDGEVQVLGSALWEDVADVSVLRGGWFAGQDPAPRQQFINRYLRTFGTVPPVVASLAYDATALAAVLASRNWPYTKDTLTQTQGFAGMGGMFRLENNGLVHRALTVQEINASGRRILDPAPTRF